LTEISDSYKTIVKPSEEGIFKDRGSKFIAYAFSVRSEEEVQEHIKSLKQLHHKARHWCYAWRIGAENPRFRANDDGEPNNSAGQPIYGQILSYDLTDILVVVVRYFGGIKLGVGGLINAYRTSAGLTLENAEIIEKTIDATFNLQFEYKDLNKIMRLIKEKHLKVKDQKMEMLCDFTISVRKKEKKGVLRAIEDLRCVKIKEL
jgi:uncharacterized YigZ family protein